MMFAQHLLRLIAGTSDINNVLTSVIPASEPETSEATNEVIHTAFEVSEYAKGRRQKTIITKRRQTEYSVEHKLTDDLTPWVW